MELYTKERKNRLGNRRCLESNCVSCAHVCRFFCGMQSRTESDANELSILFSNAHREPSGSILVERKSWKFLCESAERSPSCYMTFKTMNLHERSFCTICKTIFSAVSLFICSFYSLVRSQQILSNANRSHTHTMRGERHEDAILARQIPKFARLCDTFSTSRDDSKRLTCLLLHLAVTHEYFWHIRWFRDRVFQWNVRVHRSRLRKVN